MKNIISIDLDILFAPYIGIYNNEIELQNTVEYNWEQIGKKFDIRNFTYNKMLYDKILKIIKCYEPKVDKIYIAYDHSSILEPIRLELIKDKTQTFNIYNIDYHHDILYSDYQYNEISKMGICDCGSWVGYLKYNNLLSYYIWYNSNVSNFFEDYIIDKELMPIYDKYALESNDFPENLNNIILFITSSFPWIPFCYQNIIDEILNNLPQEKIEYYPNRFFVSNKKRSLYF